jgi:hypothetical protein
MMIVRTYVRKKDGTIEYHTPYIFSVEKIDKINAKFDKKQKDI